MKRSIATLAVTSSAFKEGDIMPVKHTARGGNLSPPLEFGSIAEDAETLAIIMEDLDTPMGIVTHWLVWNIPARMASIPEGIPAGKTVSVLGNAAQGRNVWFSHKYYGAEPPRRTGKHRYRISVYALNARLGLAPGTGTKKLLREIDGHLLQCGTLTVTYAWENGISR